jgi:type VI secretion system protein ImpF
MKSRDNSRPLPPGAPRRQNSYLMPTLLDRLADHAPHQQHELPESYTVTRAQMRSIIKRDLAYLLNTTNLGKLIDRRTHPEAAASTMNYGVPPLAGDFVAARAWVDIKQDIRQAILDFEPRLIPETVVVVLLEDGTAKHSGNLSFEIRGEIRMDPYPLEFTVQSTLDLETSQVHMTS